MKHLPINAIVTLKRNNATPTGLADLAVFIDQTDPMIAVHYDTPAHKTHTVIFKELLDVREQDFLEESNTTYRVMGVTHARTRHNAHTEAIVASTWGTD